MVSDWGGAREAKTPGRGMQRVVRRAPALLVDVVGVLVVLDGYGGKGHRLPQRSIAHGRTRRRILAIGAAGKLAGAR